MKFALSVIILVLLYCTTVLFIPSDYENTAPIDHTIAPPTDDDDLEVQRRQQMEALFSELETLRSKLKRQLGRIKFRLRGVMLPKIEAKKIEDTLKNGYKLLQNPKLLGAFYSPTEIADEIDNIKFILSELDDVVTQIDSQ